MKSIVYPFFLLVGLINTAQAQECAESLTREANKFSKEITIRSPLLKKVSFSKVIAKGVPTYYVSLSILGSTVNVNEHGVIILLENGKRIARPKEEIDVEANSSGDGFTYSAFVRLTPADLQLLKTQKITDFQLYIYDANLETSEQQEAQQYITCLLQAK